MKKRFLHNEVWTLTFGAAFQRANIYRNNPNAALKGNLKTDLRAFVENELLPQYVSSPPNDEVHIKNIYRLCEHSSKHSRILTNGKLNFGVGQKLLNLFLKYKWCLNEIEEPPHFPVDRRIQENINYQPIVAWTRFKDEKEYLKIIAFVKENMKEKGYTSLADFELDHFERRVASSKKNK